jgi:site-specific recombinase XerD
MAERKKREKIPNLESLTMGNCTITLTLDTRYRDESDKYHASIRFTVHGSRYFLHLGYKYTSEEWDAICKSDGRGRGGNQSQNFIDRNRLVELYNQHVDLVRDMYNKGTLKSVDNIRAVITGRISTYGSPDESTAPYANSFIGLWNEVISQKKASTAETYRNARDCFIKSGVYDVKEGYNVDVDKVKAWIAYMNEKRYTKTTIGFYLRAIRVVFKACISNGYMREKDYPFGASDPMKVKIPSGSSRKAEYLTVEQMTDLYIFYTDGEIPSTYRHPEQMKQSLGMFLAQYLCNGCNLYDLALLRYDDYYEISGHKALRFFRHKTKEHSESGSEVIIPIIPPLKRLLDDLATPAKKGELLFPFLLGEGVDPDSKKARDKIHQENHNVADRVKKIAKILEWDIEPSSTFARHSFATNMSRAKAPMDYIGFAMGHSLGNKGQITKRYISPYPIEEQMQYNSYLLDLPELKALRQKDLTKEELVQMVKDTMTKEELLSLLLDK